jgi:ATP-dependent Clp protease ATP-binding subunit ClpC
LGKEALERIVDIEIGYVNARLREQGFEVELTKEAKEFFIEKGFDPVFGARPLKRVIQRFLEDPLAEDIIRGRFAKELKKDKILKVKVRRKGEELGFE